MKTVFDIGMYDAADTAYYLESGHKVVAVEANPVLVERATARFTREIEAGRLICINAAVSSDSSPVALNISGDDLGSSSIFADRVTHRRPLGTVTVPGVTVGELIARHGVPFYMKVDIEGADRMCVLGLTRDARPHFLSFEIGGDFEELMEHVQELGYTRFKIVDQVTFRELANQDSLYDRAIRRLVRYLGYAEPALIRRAGRFFIAGRSSGPLPPETDGRWYPGAEIISRWRKAKSANALSGWYDLHAALE